MVIVYIALVCSAVILVEILNIIIAAARRKRRKNEPEPPGLADFVAHEEKRQAEARDIFHDL